MVSGLTTCVVFSIVMFCGYSISTRKVKIKHALLMSGSAILLYALMKSLEILLI